MASVYGREDRPYVLKLFTPKDYGYLRYLKLIMQMRNPHFPVLRGRPMQVTQDYWAVQLERLEPIEGSNLKLAEYASAYILDYKWLRGYESENHEQTAYANTAGKPYTRRVNYNPITALRQKMAPFEHHYPDLAEALRVIGSVVIGPGEDADLHDENYMQRGATIVITDPIAYTDVREPVSLPGRREDPQGELSLGSNLGVQRDYRSLSNQIPLRPFTRQDREEQGVEPYHPIIPGSDKGRY